MRTLIMLLGIVLTCTVYSSAKKTDFYYTLQQDTLKKGVNYNLFAKTENVGFVSFNKSKKSKDNTVFIRFGFPSAIPTSNTISSNVISSKRYNEESLAPVFDKIDIISGKYGDIVMSSDTKVRNLFTLTAVEFPLHLKLISGRELIDLELKEAGEWKIGIELKNN